MGYVKYIFESTQAENNYLMFIAVKALLKELEFRPASSPEVTF